MEEENQITQEERGDSSEKQNDSIVHPDVIKKIEELVDSKGVRDYSVDVSPGSQKGDNYLGVIAKTTIKGIDGAGQEIEYNWIVKSAPVHEAFRDILKVDQVYAREVLMYEKILPRFRQFRAERGASDDAGVTPPYLFSHLEPYRESFVMEDMKAVGYAMKNRKRPLDVNHVRLVMKAYGRLHAVSYAIKDQCPEEFRQIRTDTEEEFFKNAIPEDMDKMQEIYHARAIGCFDPAKDASLIGLYQKYSAEATRVVMDAMKLASEDEFSVVGHGDSWINNMLFKYEDPEHPKQPTKVCLLDWQLARYGSPAFDLSYFIFTCTDKALRDVHYDRMIKIYYYTLCGHLTELGSDPDRLLPFEVLRAHLERYSVFGLYISTMVLQMMMSETDEIPEWEEGKTSEDMLEEYKYESKNQGDCNRRVADNIVDFYEKGYLDFLK